MRKVLFTELSEQEIIVIVQEAVKMAFQTHQPPEPPPKGESECLLLTKKQAAKFLACSTSTIDNFARAGKLTRYYLGKTVRFKEEELMTLAQLRPNSIKTDSYELQSQSRG